MDPLAFGAVLAVIGWLGLVALLVGAVVLARAGQPIWAAFTGTGAVSGCVYGLYKLLIVLGQSS